MSNQKNKNQKPKPLERVTIRKNDSRRDTLLINVASGFGRAVQSGSSIKYTVGSDKFGYVEYTILNSKLPDEKQDQNVKKVHG